MAKQVATSLALLVLASVLSLATPMAAGPDEVKWSRVNIPGDGKSGGWVLANGSDIEHLTMAVDGTLFVQAYSYDEHGNPVVVSGATSFLFKSEDGGQTWDDVGKVKDDMAAIATAPDDADAVYYATVSAVYKSTDGGSRFTRLAGNPGGAGSNNVEITSIDVTSLPGKNFIAVATRDRDSSEFGDVYLLDEGKAVSSWIATDIGGYDVYALAFSPHFATDKQLVAVVTDETDTLVTTKIGTDAWGQTVSDARLDNSGTSVTVDTSAAIVFPSDYNITGDYVQFVAIDAGDENGDVYMIDGVDAPGLSVATDLNIGFGHGLSNVDVTGLAITGKAATANLLAGAAGSAEVYSSTDGGNSWTRGTRNAKPPTGESKTYVAMAENGLAYAATSGGSSAVSVTGDGGTTWNQTSLIDTKISNIVDLAPSPQDSQDDALFMVTWGGEHSLWRSLNGGENWERVYASSLADVDQIDRVALPPDYGNGSQVVFIAGSSDGNAAIWKSKDNGQTFTDRSVPVPIDAWAVADDETLFIASYDGSDGLVYCTTNSGLSYSTRVVAGSQSLHSIALSPDYDQDETTLIGNTNGWVFLSDDGGTSFEPVPVDAISPPFTGSITVAFDPGFGRNHTIYAASDTAGEGIYRFIVGSSDNWESIDSTLPDGAMVGQLKAAAGGTLYAANFKADGGMERCLDPTYSLGPTSETVTRGLDDGATLVGLWLCGNKLWSVDTTNTRLLEFDDTLTVPVALTSPRDKASGIGTITSSAISHVSSVSLDWKGLSGATHYRWQLNYDTDFSSVPDGFESETEATRAQLPPLEPATKYYWRVRATEPVLSPWSAKGSFTTSLGTETVAPKLDTPEAGASGVPIRPLFQWSATAGADSYELLVATDNSFAHPVITKVGDYALPATAWECDIDLSQGATYYWKVRATGSESGSAWSAVGAFTTEPPPSEAAPPPSPPAPPPPPPATTPDWTNWLLFLGVALLVTMVAVLAIMIVLLVRMRGT